LVNAILCVVLALLLVATAAPEASAAVFPSVAPGYPIELPRDEGSHPAFRTEWWYLTGWLETESGRQLGFQLTFFRNRPGVDEDNPSRFAARQVLFAHAAVSDLQHGALMRGEKSARAGFGLAEAAEGSLAVKIDDWSLRQEGERYLAVAATDEFALQLECVRSQPPLLNGKDGFSQKGPTPQFASYYYSLPQLQASGRIRIGNTQHRVRGVAWFDHEWSSGMFDEQARGWDWIGLNLDDGGALMVQRIRDTAGNQYWGGATLREPGQPDRTYSPGEIEWRPLRSWRSPRTGVVYPVEWQIAIGERTIMLRPLLDDQENDARASTGTLYWEGAVRAFDERGRAIGRGYLELTGYGERLRL
jgi:predicted secreted hydrolase